MGRASHDCDHGGRLLGWLFEHDVVHITSSHDPTAETAC